MRFRLTAAAYALMLVFTFAVYIQPFGNELDAFSVMLSLIILACVALWPRSDSVDPRERKSWADSVEIGTRTPPPNGNRA